MFTAVSTVDKWAPEKLKEQIEEKKEKNKAEEQARLEAAKKE